MRPKIISRKIKYKGLWAKIEQVKVKFPKGTVAEWENIIANDVVAVVAMDKNKNIYLTKEWRAAWEKEIIQIPAGICPYKTEKGILEQGRNELREELGLGAKKWTKLITYFFSAREKVKLHILLAQDLYESKKDPDENEIIELVKMPFAKAYKDFFNGTIPTINYTLVGLALAKKRLKL